MVDCDASEPMDIIFGIDASTSLGIAAFQTEKQFVKQVSLSRVSNDTQIGYTIFSTNVNVTRQLQYWDETDLSLFLDGLWWTGGWTNTGELIESVLSQFANHSESGRKRRLMIITDGNPCLNSADGECPFSVCQYAEPLQSAGIKTAIIAVGDNLNPIFIECIADYFIPLEVVSNNDLSDILCHNPVLQTIHGVNNTSVTTTGKCYINILFSNLSLHLLA